LQLRAGVGLGRDAGRFMTRRVAEDLRLVSRRPPGPDSSARVRVGDHLLWPRLIDERIGPEQGVGRGSD
jgi:hypothetical protein